MPCALDDRVAISYLGSMATRLLLTLLALLTGLAAQLSPAQARIVVRTEMEMSEIARAAAVPARCVSAARACPPLQRQTQRGGMAIIAAFMAAPPLSLPVRQGIDRSRQ